MGIVVTLAMLLGLLAFLPQLKLRIKSDQGFFIGRFLLVAGLWNTLWFGLQHWQVFWGQAALVSGIVMVLAAVLLLKEYKDPLLLSKPLVSGFYTRLKPLRVLIIAALLLSFLLYATTLIRLNLGLPILNY